MNWPSRRLALALLLLILASLAAVTFVVAGDLLDPGERGDTTPDVTAPTLVPEALLPRIFEVDANASRVDFTAQVAGVALDGVFPVRGGTITLEPVDDALRVHAHLEIDVGGLETGNSMFDQVLRAALASGDYPLAFFAATSGELVPVTEEPVAFTLAGELELHNVVRPHAMQVDAQLRAGTIRAEAVSALNLADHGVTLPALLGSPVIDLRAVMAAHEASE